MNKMNEGEPMSISTEPNANKGLSLTTMLSRPLDLNSFPPALIPRKAVLRRTKIWEFNPNLHCSIIGTCLSTAEPRQGPKKAVVAVQGCTDHDLHGVAVTYAGRHDSAARLLHKALDHR